MAVRMSPHKPEIKAHAMLEMYEVMITKILDKYKRYLTVRPRFAFVMCKVPVSCGFAGKLCTTTMAGRLLRRARFLPLVTKEVAEC